MRLTWKESFKAPQILLMNATKWFSRWKNAWSAKRLIRSSSRPGSASLIMTSTSSDNKHIACYWPIKRWALKTKRCVIRNVKLVLSMTCSAISLVVSKGSWLHVSLSWSNRRTLSTASTRITLPCLRKQIGSNVKRTMKSKNYALALYGLSASRVSCFKSAFSVKLS